MAATMSALRVVAPVARVSASKARVARSAVAAKPVKARSVVVRASSGDVSDRLEDALKVRRAPKLPRAAAEILSPMPWVPRGFGARVGVASIASPRRRFSRASSHPPRCERASERRCTMERASRG